MKNLLLITTIDLQGRWVSRKKSLLKSIFFSIVHITKVFEFAFSTNHIALAIYYHSLKLTKTAFSQLNGIILHGFVQISFRTGAPKRIVDTLIGFIPRKQLGSNFAKNQQKFRKIISITLAYIYIVICKFLKAQQVNPLTISQYYVYCTVYCAQSTYRINKIQESLAN